MKTKAYRVQKQLLLLLNQFCIKAGCPLSFFFLNLCPCVFGETRPLETRMLGTQYNAFFFPSKRVKQNDFLEEVVLVLPGTTYTNTVKSINNYFKNP